jgi:elongation factor Tu
MGFLTGFLLAVVLIALLLAYCIHKNRHHQHSVCEHCLCSPCSCGHSYHHDSLIWDSKERVRNILVVFFSIDPAHIQSECRIVDDIGLEPDLVGVFVTRVENDFNINIPDDQIHSSSTLDEVVEVIHKRKHVVNDAEQNNDHYIRHPNSDSRGVNLPNVTVALIGHHNHGDTTLLAALSHCKPDHHDAEHIHVQDIDDSQEELDKRVGKYNFYTYYTSDHMNYSIIDAPGHSDYVDTTIRALVMADAAIMVVALDEGPDMEQTREHLLLAYKTGVQRIIVYLNKVDLIDDPSIIKETKDKLIDLMSHTYERHQISFVVGSALRAYADPSAEHGISSIRQLVDKMDSSFSHVARSKIQQRGEPLALYVDRTFRSDADAVVSASVEQGVIQVGDKIEVMGNDNKLREVKVTNMEVFKKPIKKAYSGDVISMRLKGIGNNHISFGSVLTAPGQFKYCDTVKTSLSLLEADEGGLDHPIESGFKAQFLIDGALVKGELVLNNESARLYDPAEHGNDKDHYDNENNDAGEITLTPGFGSVLCYVKFDKPVCVFHDNPFLTMRYEGKTVGTGKVKVFVDIKDEIERC